MSLLIDAVINGVATEDDIRSLLESGVDINAQTGWKDNGGRNALMVAAQSNRSSYRKNIMKMLLDAGADIDLRTIFGNTALIYAVRYSNILSTECAARILLDAGADVNAKGSFGMSVLAFAVQRCGTMSTKNTVKLLLEADADVTAALSGLFIYAGEFSAMCTLTLLIENTF